MAGNRGALRRLAYHGADLNLPSGKNRVTALAAAMMKDQDGIMGDLLEYGVDLNTANEWGVNPLLIAIDRGRVDWVRMLLDRGADPMIVDRGGAMDYALRIRDDDARAEITALLREHRVEFAQPRRACINNGTAGEIGMYRRWEQLDEYLARQRARELEPLKVVPYIHRLRESVGEGGPPRR
jgi:ankyrin repeat protein